MNKFEQVPSLGHPMLVLEGGVTVQRDPISTTTRCHYRGTGTGELGHGRPSTVRSHAKRGRGLVQCCPMSKGAEAGSKVGRE